MVLMTELRIIILGHSGEAKKKKKSQQDTAYMIDRKPPNYLVWLIESASKYFLNVNLVPGIGQTAETEKCISYGGK